MEKKYIDSEKLIAEIERLHKAHSGKYGCDEVALNLEYLEDFITTLQQEHPEVDLEKEFGSWIDKLDDKYCVSIKDYSIQDMKDTARHFYELGRARKEE